MSAETERDVETMQHLDFAPKCEAIGRGNCGGHNRADYFVVYNDCACKMTAFVCARCVAVKITRGKITWECSTCGSETYARWLDIATLHPLGGAA